MTAVEIGRSASAAPVEANHDVPTVDIVIPVYNEEADLEASVTRLVDYLAGMPFTAQITIADNASTDATPFIAQRLARANPTVHAVHLALKGRGRALKQVWSTSSSPILAYMDVDLSTDLNALLPLVAPLLTGHSDLAIGTRLHHGSRVERGLKRELISRSYNLLLRRTLRARFTDAQCGFKAVRREVAGQLLPWVHDDAWFFDTELLVLAERAQLRIHEVAVDWVDDVDSRVDIVRTVTADLRGIARLSWSLVRGQVPLAEVAHVLGRARREGAQGRLGAQTAMFALIGIASTFSYAVIYLVLRGFLHAQAANATALLLTAVVNTAANRRVTFGITSPDGRWRHQVQGLLVLAGGLAATSGSLWLFDAMFGGGHRWWEIAVLTGTNLGVTVMRFVAMRSWMFKPRRQTA